MISEEAGEGQEEPYERKKQTSKEKRTRERGAAGKEDGNIEAEANKRGRRSEENKKKMKASRERNGGAKRKSSPHPLPSPRLPPARTARAGPQAGARARR